MFYLRCCELRESWRFSSRTRCRKAGAHGGGLLVDPGLVVGRVVVEFLLLEPEVDLLLGRLNSVAAVAHVAANFDAEVTTDGSGLGVKGVGGTKHLAAHPDNILALPDHGEDGSGVHVCDKAGEERLAGEIRVVLLQVGLAGRAQLSSDQLVASLFEPRHDLADKSPLDSVGLDSDESAFFGHVWSCLGLFQDDS